MTEQPQSEQRPHRSPIATVLLALLRFYQVWISPNLPPSCRFYPSCSAYAVEAIQVHGAARGSWLAVLRLLRCHPWHPGGVDPVPPRRSVPQDPADGSADQTGTAGPAEPGRPHPHTRHADCTEKCEEQAPC